MTIEELRQKPIGVLERRSFTIKAKGSVYEEHYSLVKGKDGKYYIGFSENGSYCSSIVREEDMLELLNDEELSFREAMDIYMQSPQLSCWMYD